jgi:hypothetical protein
MRLVRVSIVAVLVTGGLLTACSFRGGITGAATPSTARGASTSTSGSSSATGPAAATSPVTSAGSSGTSTRPAPTSGASSGDRCHTSELTGSLAPGSPGAGQRYATLVLRNTGGQTCSLRGFGGIGLADANGSALPTRQVRTGAAPASVVLPPGDSARSQLHWSTVPGPGDAQTSQCQPPATTLRVIPPDETDALSIAWTQGPVCSGGTIDQHAYTH